MTKDFSYAHQREYRFMWLPPSANAPKDPAQLNIGSLEDIASLYRPDATLVYGCVAPA